MKRKPTPATEDSLTLHGALQQIIDEKGRGGLTMVAAELGMTTSALRKRLLKPDTAWDVPTMRASILIMAVKNQRQEAQHAPPEPTEGTPAPEE